MKIRFRQKGLPHEDAVRGHAERRLQFALGRFAPRIGDVLVEVLDTNGPKGGEDKRCSLTARIDGRTIHVEDRSSDVPVAIDRAAERLRGAVSRHLERRRELHDRLSAAGPQW